MKRVTVAELNNRVDDLEKEFKTYKQDVSNMKATIKQQGELLNSVHEDTHKIVSILEGAKGWAAFGKKHGPRLIAFIFGVLVSSGMVEAETATQLKSLLLNH